MSWRLLQILFRCHFLPDFSPNLMRNIYLFVICVRIVSTIFGLKKIINFYLFCVLHMTNLSLLEQRRTYFDNNNLLFLFFMANLQFEKNVKKYDSTRIENKKNLNLFENSSVELN